MTTDRPRLTPGAILLLVGGALFVLPMIGLLWAYYDRDARAVPAALVGQDAPSFTLVDLDGSPVRLDDFVGKKVVINFWATWCQPCKIEHPVLVAAPERYPDVVFLGVIYQDDAEKARAYLRRAGSSYPHLADPDARTAVDFGVTGVPETYFVDERGIVVHKEAGVVSPPLLDHWLRGS